MESMDPRQLEGPGSDARGHDDVINAAAGAIVAATVQDPSDLGLTIGSFSGLSGSASCAWCRGWSYIGAGSAEEPRRPCPSCGDPGCLRQGTGLSP
jgi:hypothetical protein